MPNFRKLDRGEIAQIERGQRLSHAHLERLLDAADVVAGSGIELIPEPWERSSAVRREVRKVLRARGLDADWFYDYGSGARPVTRIFGLIREWGAE